MMTKSRRQAWANPSMHTIDRQLTDNHSKTERELTENQVKKRYYNLSKSRMEGRHIKGGVMYTNKS